MNISASHNLNDTDLRKALAAIAIGSSIENELLETLSKAIGCSCDDKVPKTPKHKAIREIYDAMLREFGLASRDIVAYAGEIAALPLHKAIGKPSALTAEQLQRLMVAIQDRYGFIGAQLQSVEYTPPDDLLQRWKDLGLVDHSITTETFMASVPANMAFIRDAYVMGKFITAVESGMAYAEVMSLAANTPLLLPDLHAIAVAEAQTANFITNNAADLASAAGQLWAKKQAATVRQMAIEYHSRTLTRRVLDKEQKQEHDRTTGSEEGRSTWERPVDDWRQFSSELYHTMDDKSRDWDRLAYFEIEDAKKQGIANKLLETIGPEALVYKVPLSSACPQCKYSYLQADEKTPKLFKLGDLVLFGNNIGKKPHPVKGGKVVPGGRLDGAETMQPTSGLQHPWCACLGPYEYTSYEPFAAYYKKK